MYQVKTYYRPGSVDECAKLYNESSRSRLIAGNLWLRMTSLRIGTGIDLSGCGLAYIRSEKNEIHIGAMTTLREVETNYLLRSYADGIISRSVGEIIGVPFRNMATIGASVAGKYGFSDVITPLLACRAEVVLYTEGRMPLETYLNGSFRHIFLTEVVLPNERLYGAFVNFRNSKGDFSVLNLAVTKGERWRVSVGARPMWAMLANKTAAYLRENTFFKDVAANAANLAAEEVIFGSNTRGSAAYRKKLCRTLLERSIREILRRK